MPKKTIWNEVRCDKHGTQTINKGNQSRILKITTRGDKRAFGCPQCNREGDTYIDNKGYHRKRKQIDE